MKSQAEVAAPARRHHDRAFKARLVEQSLHPGASVAAIALANGINANMLFKWRRERQRETTPAVLLPVRVMPGADSRELIAAPKSKATGVIELEIAGAQLRLRGAVDEASLCSVLRALRQST